MHKDLQTADVSTTKDLWSRLLDSTEKLNTPFCCICANLWHNARFISISGFSNFKIKSNPFSTHMSGALVSWSVSLNRQWIGFQSLQTLVFITQLGTMAAILEHCNMIQIILEAMMSFMLFCSTRDKRVLYMLNSTIAFKTELKQYFS